MNKVVLLGTVKSLPTKEQTSSGRAVTRFEVTTNRIIKDEAGDKVKVVDCHKITAAGKQAAQCQEQLKLNSMILVEGALRREDKGQCEIVATDISFISDIK